MLLAGWLRLLLLAALLLLLLLLLVLLLLLLLVLLRLVVAVAAALVAFGLPELYVLRGGGSPLPAGAGSFSNIGFAAVSSISGFPVFIYLFMLHCFFCCRAACGALVRTGGLRYCAAPAVDQRKTGVIASGLV